jgi:hypothetical protein
MAKRLCVGHTTKLLKHSLPDTMPAKPVQISLTRNHYIDTSTYLHGLMRHFGIHGMDISMFCLDDFIPTVGSRAVRYKSISE